MFRVLHLPIRFVGGKSPNALMDATKPAPPNKHLTVDCCHLGQRTFHGKQLENDITGLLWPLNTDDEQLDRIEEKLLRSRSDGSTGASKSPRVLLVYDNERVRDQFCANAQRLLDAVLEDPHASSTSSLIAHKALRYRKITPRLHEVDPRDPAFDVSAFFGVEWRRKDIPVNAE
ncbi:hypothetical protein PR003_g21049 [Phytophthora rubi]|uniref:Uncharacterized protein n=1 Tax=Phytophthora rubi TaxID=129364 RepID=A0A6A3J0J0_9STRA|nr:hypothetical protein PR002_g21919 [Phytophthora rubi]KAE9004744.1 hypothetical protein PR001_g17634 [Phytophthora rubi]KAE9307247.1 hypothetical protein PR003_g21049 [Phytophthora rubi]